MLLAVWFRRHFFQFSLLLGVAILNLYTWSLLVADSAERKVCSKNVTHPALGSVPGSDAYDLAQPIEVGSQWAITSLLVHCWLLLIGPGTSARFGEIAWFLIACHTLPVKVSCEKITWWLHVWQSRLYTFPRETAMTTIKLKGKMSIYLFSVHKLI